MIWALPPIALKRPREYPVYSRRTMSEYKPIREGQILTGALFNEPMRVETVRSNGLDTWVAGLVGTQSERFRKVTLSSNDIKSLTIIDSTYSYTGDGNLLR